LDGDESTEPQEVSSTPEFSDHSDSPTEEEGLIFNFDDETMTADYEPVDAD
jgi:hypothetical protein